MKLSDFKLAVQNLSVTLGEDICLDIASLDSGDEIISAFAHTFDNLLFWNSRGECFSKSAYKLDTEKKLKDIHYWLGCQGWEKDDKYYVVSVII